MTTSKVDIIIRIADDLVNRRYSPEISSQLAELTDYLSSHDVSASQADRMYTQVVEPSDINLVDYWSSNYISKPIYRSLKKFHQGDYSGDDQESSLELLIMVSSILNRSLVATRDSDEVTDKREFLEDVGLLVLIELMQDLVLSFMSTSYDGIDNIYKEDLFDYCSQVGLFKDMSSDNDDTIS